MSEHDVVSTRAAAAPGAAPLLILDEVTAFLDAHGLGTGTIAGERIGDGQSNVTYLLRRGDERFVLRRGPRPPLPPSTHDMLREARILRAVGRRGAPVPRVLAVCDDPAPLGVPFYVAEYVEGVVVTDVVPEWMTGVADGTALGSAVVGALAEVHSIGLDDPEIAALGRPEGYLRRQIERFRGLWDAVATRDLPQVDAIGRRLLESLPGSPAPSVVHGDYRLGNLMLRDGSPPRVRAILDWEMATLGDPLTDLGYLSATWGGRDRPPTVLELTTVTRSPGFPSRGDLVEHYAATTGRDVSGLDWYESFALWKGAVFCEAIYARWLAGERPGDTFGPVLREGVPGLLAAAADISRFHLPPPS